MRRHGPPGRVEYLPIAVYLLFFAAIAAVGAPISAALFRELPEKGAAFAIPAASIPFAIVVFWVGQLSFGRHTIALALGAVAAGGALAYRRGARPEWRAVAAAYGVFAAGFLYLAALRAADPAITPAGGEQFLHFGLVNALERAGSLPPPDVWYAGESLRYYYGTQLQVASVSMITGTELRYGFNLGIAAFYGVLVVVAYGLSGAIAARRGHSRRLGGALGVSFVALGGPTTTPIRLVTPSLPEPVAEPVGRAAFGFVARRFYDGALGAAIADLSDPGTWTWWYTRYVVGGTIQEVPMYSFVKGDLHGHALSTGYVLFAAAVAYAYYLTPAGDRRRRVAAILGLGAIAGVFGFMNTWALPTAGGLAALAVATADPHPATLLPERAAAPLRGTAGRGGRLGRIGSELGRLAAAGAIGAIVLAIGVAVASPFLVFGHVPSNEGIGLLPPRSPSGPFLVVYGGLLSMVAIYAATLGRPVLAGIDRRRLALAAACLPVAAAAALRFDLGVLLLTGSLVLFGWFLVRTDRGDFAVVVAIAGVGLLLALEVVHARLPRIDPPRWNTALKVAVQGWTLGAAGAGAAAAVVLSRAAERLGAYRAGDALSDGGAASADTEGAPDRRAALRSSLTVVSVCLLLASTLVFPFMVAGQELGPEVASGGADFTLDGHEAIETDRPAQAEAIRWLDDRSGTPTIVEAPGPSYRFTSPASTFTGLPTVVGWDHQAEYRSPEAYERRVAHVDEIYAGEWASAAAHLERYDVGYVYVGPGERERYGESLRAFDDPAFGVAFENEAVTIYRVEGDAFG